MWSYLKIIKSNPFNLGVKKKKMGSVNKQLLQVSKVLQEKKGSITCKNVDIHLKKKMLYSNKFKLL